MQGYGEANFTLLSRKAENVKLASAPSPSRYKISHYFIAEFTCLLFIQAARGGINVETERGAARTVSVLTLAAVTQDDVGNYSCRPTEGRSAVVTLAIEEG